jgi:putative ABC transport system permease protein
VQQTELAGVGLLAGFLASLVSLAVSWGPGALCRLQTGPVHWTVPLFGSLAGAALALAAGN